MQQFDHNFNQCLRHRGFELVCLDFRIDLDPFQEAFDAFEDVNKGIVAFAHVLGCLEDSDIIMG